MAISAPTGAGNVTTYTANASTSAALPKPSNTANGDVLVAAVWGRSNTAVYTAPSGWTEIAPTGGDITGPGIMRFYTHVVTDTTTEASTYTWSGGVSGRVSGVLMRLTGVSTSSIFDVASSEVTATGDASSSAVTLPSVTTTGSADLLIAMVGAQISTGGVRGAFAPPGGWTVMGTTQTTTGSAESDFGVDVLLLSAAGATGTKAFTRAAASSAGLGYMIAVKSAVTVSVSGAVTPSSADTGVSRTLTLTITNGNGNAVTWGPVDWGDGLAADAAVTTGAGVTTKTFTRTPASGGAGKTWSAPWSQA